MEKPGAVDPEPSTAVIVSNRWTRGDVMKFLHRSRSTVRRLEADGMLHPIPGEANGNGRGHEQLFDPDEVKALVREGGFAEYEEQTAPRSVEGEKARVVGDIVTMNTEHTEKSWDFALDTMKEMRLQTKEVIGAFQANLTMVKDLVVEANDRKKEADTALLEIKEHLFNRETAKADAEKKIGETKLLQESAALFVKAIIARLVGGKEAVDAATLQLLGTLSDEQQAAIFPHLNGEQLGALMILIEGKDKGAKAAAEKEKSEAAPARSNGAAVTAPTQAWFSGLSFADLEGSQDT